MVHPLVHCPSPHSSQESIVLFHLGGGALGTEPSRCLPPRKPVSRKLESKAEALGPLPALGCSICRPPCSTTPALGLVLMAPFSNITKGSVGSVLSIFCVMWNTHMT